MRSRMKKETMFTIGSFSMVISIVLSRVSGANPLVDFLAGLFMGISLPLDLGFLIKWRIERNAINNSNNQI